LDELAAVDDHWSLETLCELELEGVGTIEFRVTKWGLAHNRNRFTESDLMSYSALYANNGFFLQPTTDPQTFRLGSKQAEQANFVYHHDGLGGVYSYAHFVADRAFWIRCNETLANCVYYDDLLEASPVTDRWGIERTCSFRWSVMFSAPIADHQITAYMATILPFTEDFASMKADQLLPACLSPRSRHRD
jgi:hypothetical protein